MNDMPFPYDLPIWRSEFKLESPDGKLIAEIASAGEVSMGNPTIGTLTLSNDFELDRCNPSFIWSDDSRYLVVPRYFKRFGLFRRQHVAIIDVVAGVVVESSKTGCYFQPDSFIDGQLIVALEPHSDSETVTWQIPEDLNQFNPVAVIATNWLG